MVPQNTVVWSWPRDLQDFLYRKASSVVEWARARMLDRTFPREDYRELLELVSHYLGGQPGNIMQFLFDTVSKYNAPL